MVPGAACRRARRPPCRATPPGRRRSSRSLALEARVAAGAAALHAARAAAARAAAPTAASAAAVSVAAGAPASASAAVAAGAPASAAAGAVAAAALGAAAVAAVAAGTPASASAAVAAGAPASAAAAAAAAAALSAEAIVPQVLPRRCNYSRLRQNQISGSNRPPRGPDSEILWRRRTSRAGTPGRLRTKSATTSARPRLQSLSSLSSMLNQHHRQRAATCCG